MPTYRLDLEYDGGAFHGWQVQPGQRTVQAALTEALTRLCREPVQVTGAGRTDSGVHALGQVASFECQAEIEPRKLVRAFAGLLPHDARVWRAGFATAGFSARNSALSRHYRYQWVRHPSAFGRAWHQVLNVPVDTQAMRQAAELVVGRHDFTAFARARNAPEDLRCNVIETRLLDTGACIAFEIGANRFVHNMVRRLSGAILEVGRGRSTPAILAQTLANGDRSRGGPCLPACGLFLVEVRYPADPTFETSAVEDGPPGSIAGLPSLGRTR